MSAQRRQPLGRRVHAWLSEPENETFRDGKWRFWFIAVAGLQLLNAGLTALIFESNGNLQNYMGAILLGVGALAGWIAVGCLHYSDSGDRRLAQGVSALDSVTLLFVIAHFAFLMWAYGHLTTIQKAEADYDKQAATYNVSAEKVQAGNAKIAEAARRIAIETTKRAKLDNDTAYQQRKAAEAGGGRVPRSASAPTPTPGSGLQTSQVELERPTKPDRTSAQFMTEWDAWIRAANFGELLLCALTLIFIRNRSASVNSTVEIPLTTANAFSTAAYKSPHSTPAFRDDTVSEKRDDTADRQKATRVVSREGLKRLRETLSAIAFQYGPTHFKSDPKDDYIWIRQYKSKHGEARTVAACRARLSILDDALKMAPADFRSRLERFLKSNEFEI